MLKILNKQVGLLRIRKTSLMIDQIETRV